MKGTTEDEIAGWHHWLDVHAFEQAPVVGDSQGGLVCCSPWGHPELNTTEWLNCTETHMPRRGAQGAVVGAGTPQVAKLSSWMNPLSGGAAAHCQNSFTPKRERKKATPKKDPFSQPDFWSLDACFLTEGLFAVDILITPFTGESPVCEMPPYCDKLEWAKNFSLFTLQLFHSFSEKD